MHSKYFGIVKSWATFLTRIHPTLIILHWIIQMTKSLVLRKVTSTGKLWSANFANKNLLVIHGNVFLKITTKRSSEAANWAFEEVDVSIWVLFLHFSPSRTDNASHWMTFNFRITKHFSEFSQEWSVFVLIGKWILYLNKSTWHRWKSWNLPAFTYYKVHGNTNSMHEVPCSFMTQLTVWAAHKNFSVLVKVHF